MHFGRDTLKRNTQAVGTDYPTGDTIFCFLIESMYTFLLHGYK